MLTAFLAGVAAVLGHIWTRRFVGRRLRFTRFVEKPYLSLAAGIGTAVASGLVLAFIPFFGAGTALALGAGVGTGVALGRRDAKGPLLIED